MTDIEIKYSDDAIKRVDFNNIPFPPSGIAYKKRLTRKYTAEELWSLMIDEWIYYSECKKCGRYDYCKYRDQPHRPYYPVLDTKCGVAVTAIINYVQNTFHVLDKLNIEQKTHYLFASYNFCRFVCDAEIDIGRYQNEEISKSWSEAHLSYYSSLPYLTEYLTGITRHLSQIPYFNAGRALLLVEGESELIFILTSRELNNSWFDGFLVESYGGKSHKKKANLILLKKIFSRDGYTIFIQGDNDSHLNDTFQDLKKNNFILPDNAFTFKHDFKSSIPRLFLFDILCNLKIINDGVTEISLKKFLLAVADEDVSVVKQLKANLGINIDSYKVQIAAEMARLYEAEYLWTNKKIEQTELGRFIEFIKQVYLIRYKKTNTKDATICEKNNMKEATPEQIEDLFNLQLLKMLNE